uniref:Uncharacterized protein n=1 Tax=Mus spicilegus TaxID=10103 RepID=A0A8C6H490_MUSSI
TLNLGSRSSPKSSLYRLAPCWSWPTKKGSIFLFFSGRRHPAKSLKLRRCCHLSPRSKLTTWKGNHTRPCRLCRNKLPVKSWVVPGALPQI